MRPRQLQALRLEIRQQLALARLQQPHTLPVRSASALPIYPRSIIFRYGLQLMPYPQKLLRRCRQFLALAECGLMLCNSFLGGKPQNISLRCSKTKQRLRE